MTWLASLLARALRLAGHPRGPLPAERFDFRLARDLGMTVAQLRRMAVSEYVAWVALAVVEREEAAAEAARRR